MLTPEFILLLVLCFGAFILLLGLAYIIGIFVLAINTLRYWASFVEKYAYEKSGIYKPNLHKGFLKINRSNYSYGFAIWATSQGIHLECLSKLHRWLYKDIFIPWQDINVAHKETYFRQEPRVIIRAEKLPNMKIEVSRKAYKSLVTEARMGR